MKQTIYIFHNKYVGQENHKFDKDMCKIEEVIKYQQYLDSVLSVKLDFQQIICDALQQKNLVN